MRRPAGSEGTQRSCANPTPTATQPPTICHGIVPFGHGTATVGSKSGHMRLSRPLRAGG